MTGVSVKEDQSLSLAGPPRRRHQRGKVDPNSLPLCLPQRNGSLLERHTRGGEGEQGEVELERGGVEVRPSSNGHV